MTRAPRDHARRRGSRLPRSSRLPRPPAALAERLPLRGRLRRIYFIAILGLNILTGYTGQISLGHGAFMAIGGYTTAMLVGRRNVRDLWTIPPGAAIAGGAGAALRIAGAAARPLPRARDVRIHRSRTAILKKFDDFTGRTEGIQLFGRPGFTGGDTRMHVLGRTLVQRLALLPELDDRGCPVRRGVGRARRADGTHFPRDSGPSRSPRHLE